MKFISYMFIAAVALSSHYSHAQQGADLLKAKGCLNCHAPDQKKLGPSFRDIAAKYKGVKDAEPNLTAELKSAKGHPKVAATDAELKSMVEYMLKP